MKRLLTKKMKVRKMQNTRRNGGAGSSSLRKTQSIGDDEVHNFLQQYNFDDIARKQFPHINFESEEVFEAIKETEKFQEMEAALCDEERVPNLLCMFPTLKTNSYLRRYLLLKTNDCMEQKDKELRLQGVQNPSVFLENLSKINAIVEQFAIENFQGTAPLHTAITNLKGLEQSIRNHDYRGDISDLFMQNLTSLLLSLPLRKPLLLNKQLSLRKKNDWKKYCHSLAWEACPLDPACKQKKDILGRRQCVSK